MGGRGGEELLFLTWEAHKLLILGVRLGSPLSLSLSLALSLSLSLSISLSLSVSLSHRGSCVVAGEDGRAHVAAQRDGAGAHRHVRGVVGVGGALIVVCGSRGSCVVNSL